jgi:hypothetical protein
MTTTGGVLYQARITWPESPESPIAEADFQLSRKDDHPLPTRGRVPVNELLSSKILQPDTRCGLDFPELQMVWRFTSSMWHSPSAPVYSRYTPIIVPFSAPIIPTASPATAPVSLLPRTLEEGWSEESTLYGVATFR